MSINDTLLDPDRRTELLSRDARLSLIAGALIGVHDPAEGLDAERNDLARSVFAVTLKALALRNHVRRQLRSLDEE